MSDNNVVQHELLKHLRAMIMIQVEQLKDEPKEQRKIELLLAEAGFSASEVGRIVGKSQAAAAKAITRARAD